MKKEDIDNDSHTKSIILKHPFRIESMSLAENRKFRNMVEQVMQKGSIKCYAQNKRGKIFVYLEDGTLYHSVMKGTKQEEKIDHILQREGVLVGEVCSHDSISTNRYFLIKLYYDYISGNHDIQDIIRLWIRDSTASMLGIPVPKAKYVGDKNVKDKHNVTHSIEDTVDIEMDDEHFREVVKAIDPHQDGSMANGFNVMAIIPQWASQAAYFVDTKDESLWIAPSFNADILDQVHQNEGIRGRVINYHNNYDGTYHFEFKFNIEETSLLSNNSQASDNEDTNTSTEPSISEEVFVKFINENIGCDVHNAPNSSWKYDHTDFLGSLSEQYETYYFNKRVIGNPQFKEIFALVVKGRSVNFSINMNMNKREIYSFINRYKKLFFPDYSLTKCKQEYGKEKYSILVDDVKPNLSISFSSIMGPGNIVFFTSFCNKSYIDK